MPLSSKERLPELAKERVAAMREGSDTKSSVMDHVQSILEERARKLAVPEPGTIDTEMVELLRFRLAYKEYALEMQYVQEVILTGEITPVPGVPAYISGICASRGQIISLVDLRALFTIQETGLTDLNRVIVISNGRITFGILADDISGIGTIPTDHIFPSAPDPASAQGRYFKGTVGDTFVVLDAAAILSDPLMIIEDS
jgi:purine-binding chemotaxis protein CheW